MPLLNKNTREASSDADVMSKIEKLTQLKSLFDDGVISLEEMTSLREQVLECKPQKKSLKKDGGINRKKSMWFAAVIVGALVATFILVAVFKRGNPSNDNTTLSVYDVQDETYEEPMVEQPPEWIQTQGQWLKDQNSALLRLQYNGVDVFLRYYPGDRFEVSAPNIGINSFDFKLKEPNGEVIKMTTQTARHIQGEDRVEIDEPESVKKLYRLLERGDFVMRTALFININVGSEGHGLAEFVWHKFTENDPYTNEVLGKPVSNDGYTTPKQRVYDVDPQEGMTSDEFMELIIRSEFGNENTEEIQKLVDVFFDGIGM